MSAHHRHARETKASAMPAILPVSGVLYKIGDYLGKGGFAKCYEAVNLKTQQHVACKAISTAMLNRGSNKERVAQEISIQRNLDHPNIVKFLSYHDDSNNVYMMLELCSNKSLMEMHRRRGTLTEPEARYFLRQIDSAVIYLHANLIIHRDLKLGNVFINENMVCKVGDFGLATKLNYPDERKNTVCGTPNYIAPEILYRKRHSFEVDIWALGCILYTLLIGRPPFETKDINVTYDRIKHNIFTVPSTVGAHAASLIKNLLAHECEKRPKAEAVLQFPFFTEGFNLLSLPASSLSVEPRINASLVSGGVTSVVHTGIEPSFGFPLSNPAPQDAASMIVQTKESAVDYARQLAHILQDQIVELCDRLQNSHGEAAPVDVFSDAPDFEAENPNLTPNYFIDKWVDYTDRYGLGVALNDGTVCVDFNDGVKMSVNQEKTRYVYISPDGLEHYFPSGEVMERMIVVADIRKKHKLTQYFMAYMAVQLASATNQPKALGADISRPPYIFASVRTKIGMALYLSNGTTQINYFKDHIKIIFDPTVQSISVISQDRKMHTYSYDTLLHSGVSSAFLLRLTWACAVLDHLVARVDAPNPRNKALSILSL